MRKKFRKTKNKTYPICWKQFYNSILNAATACRLYTFYIVEHKKYVIKPSIL